MELDFLGLHSGVGSGVIRPAAAGASPGEGCAGVCLHRGWWQWHGGQFWQLSGYEVGFKV